jgi:glycerol-3-phosphate acyltransferase PlsX
VLFRSPRFKLLNIGEEEKKGNLLTRAAYQYMKGSKDFYFIGNVEESDFFHEDRTDVIATNLIERIKTYFNND